VNRDVSGHRLFRQTHLALRRCEGFGRRRIHQRGFAPEETSRSHGIEPGNILRLARFRKGIRVLTLTLFAKNCVTNRITPDVVPPLLPQSLFQNGWHGRPAGDPPVPVGDSPSISLACCRQHLKGRFLARSQNARFCRANQRFKQSFTKVSASLRFQRWEQTPPPSSPVRDDRSA